MKAHIRRFMYGCHCLVTIGGQFEDTNLTQAPDRRLPPHPPPTPQPRFEEPWRSLMTSLIAQQYHVASESRRSGIDSGHADIRSLLPENRSLWLVRCSTLYRRRFDRGLNTTYRIGQSTETPSGGHGESTSSEPMADE